MHRIAFLIALSASLLFLPARAIQTNGTYDTTAPTNADIPNWTSGWGTSGITGWTYVGQVNGASGVYLGNGWVLTAAHVGAGNCLLDGTTYNLVANSGQLVDYNPATMVSADLELFQIQTSPSLPSLTLSLALPTAFSPVNNGSTVAMLGYGGSAPLLSWGLDTVTQTNQTIDLTQPPNNMPYISNDFITVNGTTTYGARSVTNNSTVVSGDSGGGDFTYNSALGIWELTGINEVNGTFTNSSNQVTGTFSGMVQLNTYAAQIESITGIGAVPEPSTWMLLGFGLILITVRSVRSAASFREARQRSKRNLFVASRPALLHL
jgi:hypothetical protein